MNRFNFVGPAAQTISAASAITSFTEGNRKLAKEQKQNRNLARDRTLLNEGREVESATGGDVSVLEYAQMNKAETNKQIDIYAKRYGASNAEEGYRLNEPVRSEEGTNIRENVIKSAQRSMDDYKAKNRQPELRYNTFTGTSTPDLSSITSEEEEV